MQFVYKSCGQILSSPDGEQLANLLSDVIYSHCVHPNSGPEFTLLFSVICHQPDDFVCPICLFSPVAPRMTPCGHIFCADCLTAHFSISERFLCPICYDEIDPGVVVRADLRLYSKVDRLVFKKIVRSRSNVICFLADSDSRDVLPTASDPSALFPRFCLADSEYVQRIIESERTALTAQIATYAEYRDPIKDRFLAEVAASLECETGNYGNGPAFLLETSQTKDDISFFQDSLGRLLFLDPLSTKMICEEFGDLRRAPPVLEFRALKATTFTVDQSARTRFRSLAHLPTGAEVQFLLADFGELVSPEVLARFSAQIAERLHADEPEVESEEEERPLTEADFPSLGPATVKTVTKVSAWTKVTLAGTIPRRAMSSDADFPSLAQAFPAKPAVPKKASPWAKVEIRPK